ncbi:hypothetical protein [Kribbella sindirgiensis]|uniref:hypothetical protein n=1 Tax=Kribbella sindirgiensis TaxID=1124744 RepID=UPI00192D68F7|nr:hypothetical protein [Kribbella sindirgiensis]
MGETTSFFAQYARWFRFLHDRWTAWERAERSDVREFVELLREAPVPQRPNRRPEASPPGSVNPLSVLFGFYEWACASGLGQLMNPVPAQRSRATGGPNAHQTRWTASQSIGKQRTDRRHRGRCGGRS